MDGYYETMDLEEEMSDLEYDGFELEEEYGEPELMDLEDYEDQPDGEFLKGILRRARHVMKRVARSPIRSVLKNLANQAATAAGAAVAGPAGAQIASQVAKRVVRENSYDSEYDLEAGDEEMDFEALGGDMEVLWEMQHLAAMAANAETEPQADQFIGAIANLAGTLLPQLLGGGDNEAYDYEAGFEGEEDYAFEDDPEFLPALLPLAASVLPSVLPLVKRGIQQIGKVMNASARTRRATLPALPKIAAKTVTAVAKQARKGNLTPQKVAATVAKTAAKTLASPAKVAQARMPVAAGPAQAKARPGPMAGRSARPAAPQARWRASGRRRIIRPRYCVE